MKTFEQDFKTNPTFNSVVGLSNTTYDNTNIRSGQMATEDQILQLHQREAALQSRINYCCRDIVVWKTYLRIVEEKTGIVVSDFFDNMATGHARRGVPFTVYFSRPFDTSKFIMDRSASDRINYHYNFKITTTGTSSTTGNTKGYEDGMTQMLNDYYEDTTVINGVYNSPWPKNVNSSSANYQARTNIIQPGNNSAVVKPLPQRVTERDNIYYVYLDSTDNKIKIDILGKNQFQYDSNFTTKAYDTFFATQWVLKEGASL